MTLAIFNVLGNEKEGIRENTSPGVQNCPSDNIFKCNNGAEICEMQVCDAVTDCEDGTDEDTCGELNVNVS